MSIKSIIFLSSFFLIVFLCLIEIFALESKDNGIKISSQKEFIKRYTITDLSYYNEIMAIRFYSISDKTQLLLDDPLAFDKTKASFVYGVNDE